MLEGTQNDFLLTTHRFLDEAGDTTFFGPNKQPIVGQNGVSLCFAIGIMKFLDELAPIRAKVKQLQEEVAKDRYLNVIPSIDKKIKGKGFFFHATDDSPEVRERFFRFIESVNCSCEIVVARKSPYIFLTQHQGNDSIFYADVLSHVLKNRLKMSQKLVLNIAERGTSTKNANLQRALDIAVSRFEKRNAITDVSSRVVFNVQNHHTEPLLNIIDYMCWSVQRVFERGETRYYDFLGEKIRLVVDLYDQTRYEGNKNYYSRGNRLSAANKISPPPS